MPHGIEPHPFESQLAEIFEEAGIPFGYLKPEDQFAQYARTQFRPGPSGMRSAFYDVGNPLLQQYYLSQPFMPSYGGFADFMGGGEDVEGFPTFGPGVGNMRGLAERAAFMGRMPAGQFFQYVNPLPIGIGEGQYGGPAITSEMQAYYDEMSKPQQLLYRQQYGTGEEAAVNQAALANLLALQRTQSGGLYGGAMGQAITGALSELRGQLLARNPEANFLDWYLSRTEGGQGLGGFLTAPPPVKSAEEMAMDMGAGG